jgi:hypothetical protein
MVYELHLTYRDPCCNDTVRITVYTAGEICAEICKTAAYEAHWFNRHASLDGPFPFQHGTFPGRSFVHGCISTMAIGHRKLVYQGRVGDAAYTATVRRFS